MARFASIVAPGTAMTLQVPSFAIPGTPGAASACRFAGEPARWVHVGSTVAIRAFARSAASVFSKAATDTSGNPAVPTGPWTLIELSPLPGFAPAVFRQLGGGMPIQYVLLPQSSPPSGIDQTVFAAGDTVYTTTTTGDAWFGIVFQDRIVRDPATWGGAIAAALIASATDPGDWPGFVTALADLRAATVYLVDHVGRPLTTGEVTIDAGAGPQTRDLAGRDGDSGVVLPAGGRATVTYMSAGFPLVSGVDVPGAATGAPYQLAPNERHVQLLDADQWLAPPTSGVIGVRRWCPNSHVEPIADGTPYFTRLVSDLRSAKNGGGAHFIGWAFTKGSVIDSTKPWDLVPWQDDTQFVPLFKDLVANGCQLRFLVNQLVQLEVDPLDDGDFILLVLMAAYMLESAMQGFAGKAPDPAGIGLFLAGLPLATFVLYSTVTTDLIRLYAEPSHDTFPDLAALGPGVAAWSKYPPTVDDNPLAHGPLTFPGGMQLDDATRFGNFHQKGAVIRFPAGDYVTYIGGIDINSDRADTPIHRALLPYHDVHACVTGPAAQDVAITFDQRLPLAGLTPAFPPPGSAGVPDIPDLPPSAGQHLVQIARTYFVPKAGSGTVALPFAPHGETTIFDTLLAAFGQARDFIYIEDQYFTPNDEYVAALLQAADNGVRALVLTLCQDAGQPFGEIRKDQVLAALCGKWGSRLRSGTPRRRYVNPTPAANVNLGRCLLRTTITEWDGRITIGPISRTPAPPFWVFVDGELMLCTSQSGPDDTASDGRTFYVERGPDGPDPRWGANAGKHNEGSPALCVRVPNVYVHAKCMVIDDVFMTVGSANVNRRGHFFDGELNVFAIPQRLKNDPTNPARIMRCRLWAEHLGLPPEMGLSLLGDPLSALTWFDRSWYVGSAYQRLTWMGSATPDISFGTGVMGAVIGGAIQAYKPILWPTIVDPTTTADSNAASPGPEYP